MERSWRWSGVGDGEELEMGCWRWGSVEDREGVEGGKELERGISLGWKGDGDEEGDLNGEGDR